MILYIFELNLLLDYKLFGKILIYKVLLFIVRNIKLSFVRLNKLHNKIGFFIMLLKLDF